MHNILLTGIPRSGLTVVSALLDTMANSVSLNEPNWQKRKSRDFAEPLPYCKWLVGDYVWHRQQLLTGKPVRDFRGQDGTPLTDGIKDPRITRNENGDVNDVFFTMPNLTPHFTLTMKQHAIYTALLPELVAFDFFKVVAVIRHPFDVIQSWRSLENHPLNEGKLTINPNWWPELQRVNALDVPPLARMVELYEAFCERYYQLREQITILKFEEVMENPALVSVLVGETAPSPGIRLLENRQRILVREETDEIKALFQKNGVFTRHFYEL